MKPILHQSFVHAGFLAALFLCGCSVSLFGQIHWKELNNYFSESDEPERTEMLLFLKNNIKKHYTDNYFWQDSTGQRVTFNELEYPDFLTSTTAFESLKQKHGKLKPVRTRHSDEELITNNVIIENIDETIKYSSLYDKPIVMEYLLPYRSMSEPVQPWRSVYFHRFSGLGLKVGKDKPEEIITTIKDNITQWFICTYNVEKRPDPIPYLGAQQLLLRKKGGCEDVANLMVFALRSMGVPCAVDIIPYWGTATGGHVLNTAFDTDGRKVHFDALISSDKLYEMLREPGKVFRMTYSENKSLVAFKTSNDHIPANSILAERHYIDVTDEYWNTKDLDFDISPNANDSIVYANVFNGGKWRPVWFGIRKGSTVQIDKLCEGVIYVPSQYQGNKNTYIGNPVAFSGDSIIRFDPSTQTHNIRVDELPGYLKYKTGKIYTLYYFNKRWIKHQKKIPGTGGKFLTFKNVPKGALLLLRCEESNGKERPFTINESGKRTWW